MEERDSLLDLVETGVTERKWLRKLLDDSQAAPDQGGWIQLLSPNKPATL
jgi:hypothetical protein